MSPWLIVTHALALLQSFLVLTGCESELRSGKEEPCHQHTAGWWCPEPFCRKELAGSPLPTAVSGTSVSLVGKERRRVAPVCSARSLREARQRGPGMLLPLKGHFLSVGVQCVLLLFRILSQESTRLARTSKTRFKEQQQQMMMMFFVFIGCFFFFFLISV